MSRTSSSGGGRGASGPPTSRSTTRTIRRTRRPATRPRRRGALPAEAKDETAAPRTGRRGEGPDLPTPSRRAHVPVPGKETGSRPITWRRAPSACSRRLGTSARSRAWVPWTERSTTSPPVRPAACRYGSMTLVPRTGSTTPTRTWWYARTATCRTSSRPISAWGTPSTGTSRTARTTARMGSGSEAGSRPSATAAFATFCTTTVRSSPASRRTRGRSASSARSTGTTPRLSGRPRSSRGGGRGPSPLSATTASRSDCPTA
mmetsp:Transcript_36280/g.81602  ORF Transcript_36280/g.81602 Transcript_36280/m.81602 type:complete len:261 (+) Transcript_36280:619-1401(+)